MLNFGEATVVCACCGTSITRNEYFNNPNWLPRRGDNGHYTHYTCGSECDNRLRTVWASTPSYPLGCGGPGASFAWRAYQHVVQYIFNGSSVGQTGVQ